MSAELSVVVPALNEREALPELITEIKQVCQGLGRHWELIVVDDGSTDGTFELLAGLAEREPRIRCVKLRRNFGKSAALAIGLGQSTGSVIVTIDGDGQDDPADIPALLERLEAGADLVSGWKQQRRDRAIRRIASRGFNFVAARLSGLPVHDMNCGLKAYRSECARSLEIYGEMHRFIPMLAAQQGWRVAEVPVGHRPRRHGRSRFGRERYGRGALDLLTVTFLGRYQHRPLHLFGGIGMVLAIVGLAISAYLTVLRLSGESIGQRPLLFLGILLIVVGVQFLTLGLLGQMLVLIRRDREGATRSAQVERVSGGDSGRSARETNG